MTRHAAPAPTRDRRVGVGARLGMVLGGMTLVSLVVASVLFVQLGRVATTYDGILRSEVQAALQARETQVEFRKEVQGWKNILLRGSGPDDLAFYVGQFHDETSRVDQLGKALVAATPDDAVRDEVRQFLVEHDALERDYEAALAPFVAGGAADLTVPDRAVRGHDLPATTRIDDIVARSDKAVADRVAAQDAHVAGQQRGLLTVCLLALGFLLAAAAFGLASVVRPVRALTRAASRAAQETLPEALATVRRTPGAAPPALPAVEVGSRDELRDIADALTTIQANAVALAVDQHRAERAAAGTLVNLGRRNQSLLKRTLEYISELESDEDDPDVLARLFRLDHATTRIRRNAESMLVLAGADQTRTWSRPVPIHDVVRAALSEIEDYARVDLHDLEEAALRGASVADVVHLVAELAENATHFSPPQYRVSVGGQRTPEGYRLRVVDQGVGMSAAELTAANDRIARAADTDTDSPLLGLYVVGRLAARHGITVRLEASVGAGVTAAVTIPHSLTAEATPAGQTSTSGAHRSRDTATTRHRVVPPQPARQARRASRSRVPQPAMALAAASPTGHRSDAGLPPLPDPRGRSWAVPSNAASATPGTLTGWFDALADPVPDRTATPDRTRPRPPADEPATVGRRGIPRRVRGAQLPDVGDARSAPEFLAPDPDQARRQLSALHVGVERAQAEQAEQAERS